MTAGDVVAYTVAGLVFAYFALMVVCACLPLDHRWLTDPAEAEAKRRAERDRTIARLECELGMGPTTSVFCGHPACRVPPSGCSGTSHPWHEGCSHTRPCASLNCRQPHPHRQPTFEPDLSIVTWPPRSRPSRW